MIEFTWNALTSPSNGGVDVDYRVTWNQGEAINEWVTLAESTSMLEYFYLDTLIEPKKVYLFKVYAFNLFGYSPEPSAFRITTFSAPIGLAAPSTTFSLDVLAVKL